MNSILGQHRKIFHDHLAEKVLTLSAVGIASNADKASEQSRAIAKSIAIKLGAKKDTAKQKGQTSGSDFETLCEQFIRESFKEFRHLRPGSWEVEKIGGSRSKDRLRIAEYEQYQHLQVLQRAIKGSPELEAALGADYLITPDIIVFRNLEDDTAINLDRQIVDDYFAKLAILRKSNGGKPILHASISCKWTIRSDRSQNSRSEGLNLIRNRKGHLPHVMVVTGEPMPSRIASIALGTGDIDCVYHFALQELIEAVNEFDQVKLKRKSSDSIASDLLKMMIDGKRLKDISDLPLDLAV